MHDFCSRRDPAGSIPVRAVGLGIAIASLPSETMTFLDQETEEACTLAFHLRMKAGLTQAAFARAAGLSLSTIKRIESGRRKPSRQMLERLASSSGVSLTEVEEDVLPKLREWLAIGKAEDEPDDELDVLAAPSPFGVGAWPTVPAPAPGLRRARPGETASWLYDVNAVGSSLEDRPPEAPALSWSAYLALWKAVLHHAMGNDKTAAEELSITKLMLTDNMAPGSLFIFYLLKVAYLVAAGEMEAASDLLPGLDSASSRLPPPGEILRTRWIGARIPNARGGRERAQGALAELQAEFADLEMALETICVWADRAALDLEGGRSSDPLMRREELAWARQDRSLSPKMAGALDIVLSLLEQGSATPRVARRLVAFLLGTQLHDGPPFEPFPKIKHDSGSP